MARREIRRYATYSSQDDEQFRVDASGSTELPSGLLLNAGIGWSDTTAGRGTFANDLSVGEPLKMRELALANFGAQELQSPLCLNGAFGRTIDL
jgi:hypothetical protein